MAFDCVYSTHVSSQQQPPANHGNTKAFVVLVMLVSMLQINDLAEHTNLEVIEFFAGTGRLCRLSKSMGIPCEAHDLGYDDSKIKSAMNINDSAGYVRLSLL